MIGFALWLVMSASGAGTCQDLCSAARSLEPAKVKALVVDEEVEADCVWDRSWQTRNVMDRIPILNRFVKNKYITHHEYTSPIHHAVDRTRGGADMVALLAELGADLDAKTSSRDRPLMIAVAKANRTSLEALLEAGADPNLAGKEGTTPLTEAVANSQTALVGLLVDGGATITVDHLVRALEQADEAIAAKFIDAGFPIDTRTTGDQTALGAMVGASNHAMAKWLLDRGADPLLVTLAELEDLSMVELLLERGGDGSQVDLSLLIAKGTETRALERLIDRGVPVDGPVAKTLANANPNLMRPLHAAIERSMVPLIKVLVDRGADATHERAGANYLAFAATRPELSRPTLQALLDDGVDPSGLDAGLAKAHHGHEVADIELLLALGADPLALEPRASDTSEHLAWLFSVGADPNKLALDQVVKGGDLARLTVALAAGADADGHGAVAMAVERDRPDALGALLDAGADPNAVDADGVPVIFGAKGDTLRQLADRGGDLGVVVQGRSLLDVRYAAGDLDGFDWLLQRDVSPDVVLWDPIIAAGDEETLGSLLRHGADVNRDDGAGPPLQQAVLAGQSPLVAELITAGATAANVELSAVIASGGLKGDQLDQLIEFGADIERATAAGDRPLHAAIRLDDSVLVGRLIAAGADWRGTNGDGWNAMKLAKKLKFKTLIPILKGKA